MPRKSLVPWLFLPFAAWMIYDMEKQKGPREALALAAFALVIVLLASLRNRPI